MTAHANPNSMIHTMIVPTHFHQVFIDEEIGEPAQYRELIALLGTAQEFDKVELHLNSPGGYLSTAGAIVEALQNTPATTTAVITGNCMSATTLLMLACDNVIVTASARVMVHTCSFGSFGMSPHIKAHVDYISEVEARMMREAYAGFLSESELDQLIDNGKEFWFDKEETERRLKNRKAYVESLAEMEQEES